MIILITGTPGAGKTLRSVQNIMGWLKEGLTVFTNINGLTADGDLRHFDEFIDWTDTPDGSVVVFDEAQQHFGADGGRGRSDRKDIAGLETHRHTGHTIVFITQHPRLLHSHVTRLVGRHEHVARMFGTQNTFLYWLDRLMNVDSRSDLKLAQQEHWSYPTHLFSHYKSASMHIKTRKIPKKVFYFAVFIVFVLMLTGFAAYKVFNSPAFLELAGLKTVGVDAPSVPTVESAKETVSSVQQPPAPAAKPVQKVDYPAQDWALERAQATPVAGCIASHNPDKPRCTCYSTNMTPIVMPTSECFSRIREPLPRTLISGNGGRSEGAQRSEHTKPPADTFQASSLAPHESSLTVVNSGTPGLLW